MVALLRERELDAWQHHSLVAHAAPSLCCLVVQPWCKVALKRCLCPCLGMLWRLLAASALTQDSTTRTR